MRASRYGPSRAIHSDLPPDVTREIERLTSIIDRDLDSDRRFFGRRPHRSYRVRRAFPSERRAMEVLEPDLAARFADLTLFVAVRQIRPGQRFRSCFSGPSWTKTDLDDATAKAVFDAITSDEARTIMACFERTGRP